LTAQQVINETPHFDFSCLSFTTPWRPDDEPNPEANIYATAEAAYDALDDLTRLTVEMQALFSGCLVVTVAQLNGQHQLTTSDSFKPRVLDGCSPPLELKRYSIFRRDIAESSIMRIL
jgi:hypothetical protein